MNEDRLPEGLEKFIKALAHSIIAYFAISILAGDLNLWAVSIGYKVAFIMIVLILFMDSLGGQKIEKDEKKV